MHEFLGKVSYTVADFLNAQITGHGEFWYLGRSNQSAELAGILIGLVVGCRLLHLPRTMDFGWNESRE